MCDTSCTICHPPRWTDTLINVLGWSVVAAIVAFTFALVWLILVVTYNKL